MDKKQKESIRPWNYELIDERMNKWKSHWILSLHSFHALLESEKFIFYRHNNNNDDDDELKIKL